MMYVHTPFPNNVFALDQRPNFGEVFAVMDAWHPDRSPQMIARIRADADQAIR